MAWAVSGNIRGPQGIQGPQGVQGPAGTGIAIAGDVATYADLPTTLTSADAGKGYLVQADGLLYIWSGTAFPADGSGVEFQGPQGPKGDTGATGTTGQTGAAATVAVGTVTGLAAGATPTVSNGGTSGAAVLNFGIPAGAKGDQGTQGVQGVQGIQGATGTRGSNWYTGSGAPGAITGSQSGDQYLDTASGDVYTLS